MKNLKVMVGLPRSGKTTKARLMGHPIVNPDSIRLALHGHRFLESAEPFVWSIAYLMVDALFRAGHHTVVVDATNVTQKRRDEWLTRFPDANIEFEIINTSPMICIERALNDDDYNIIPIIQKMTKEWDLPKPWLPEEEKA